MSNKKVLKLLISLMIGAALISIIGLSGFGLALAIWGGVMGLYAIAEIIWESVCLEEK